MGKADLVSKIADATDFKKKGIEEVLNEFMMIVREDVLENGVELRLRDFGTFRKKVTAPRTARNPKTGEALKVPAVSSVSFKASATSMRIRHDK
jgi:DNA-binding protein HU-beta